MLPGGNVLIVIQLLVIISTQLLLSSHVMLCSLNLLDSIITPVVNINDSYCGKWLILKGK